MAVNNLTVRQFVERAHQIIQDDSELSPDPEYREIFWRKSATFHGYSINQHKYSEFSASPIDQSNFKTPSDTVISGHSELLQLYDEFRATALREKTHVTMINARKAFIWVINAALNMYCPQSQ